MDEYMVQEYVAEWLSTAGVPGLAKAWPGRPNATGPDWSQGTCQAIVDVTASNDVRHSGPAANPATGLQPGRGIREMTFAVLIEVWHAWPDPNNWLAGEEDLKRNVVGGILKAVKYDPTLGTHAYPDPLFNSAGEGRAGIRVRYNEAYGGELGREQVADITLTVCAYVTG